MEQHSANSDDLSRLERCLSAWQPAEAGLNADAVLFAAGRASVRPSPTRFVWPTLTAIAAVLAIVLGVRLVHEQSERLALAQQIQRVTAKASISPSLDTDTEPRPQGEMSPDSLFVSHRLLENGLDAWPPQVVARAESPLPAVQDPPVLRVGRLDVLLDP